MAESKREICTGKKASHFPEGHYGRGICATCGNSVFPNSNGDLRKHVAKKFGE